MNKPLAAIQIIKGAWANFTHSDDRRIKVGKLTRNIAYEIVFQPSHTDFGTYSKPYAVGFATYDPSNREGSFIGNHVMRFELAHEAKSFVENVKSALKYDAQTSSLFANRYEQMGRYIDKGEISEAAWKSFKQLYDSPNGYAFKILDFIYYVEYGEILKNLKGMIKS